MRGDDEFMKETVPVTVGEVAEVAIRVFVDECMQVARDNWCGSQVEMLDALFEAVSTGCELKCVKCEHFGRVADAPDAVSKGCLWGMLEGEDGAPPCEIDN